MEKVKKFLREGTEGLFLLLIAVLIFTNFPASSKNAESKAIDNGKVSNVEQVLGETDIISEEIVQEISEDVLEGSNEEVEAAEVPSSQESVTEEVSADPEKEENEKYNIQKRLLKKYCDRKGTNNKKKCKKYCSKVRNISKEVDGYDDLHKKYCKSKKNTSKKKTEDKSEVGNKTNNTEDNSIESEAENIIESEAENITESDVVVTKVNELNFRAGSKEFKIAFEEGESVFSLMKKAKNQGKIDFKYDDYGGDLGVMITEINGVKNGSDLDWMQNKYWILYVSGKSSLVGCSSHKLNKNDTSVEWKYEKYSY